MSSNDNSRRRRMFPLTVACPYASAPERFAVSAMLDQVLARELRVPARDLLKRIRNTGLSAQQTGLVLQSGDTERLVDLIGEPLPFDDTPGAAILVLREVRLESPRALSETRGVPRDATLEALEGRAGTQLHRLRARHAGSVRQGDWRHRDQRG